MLIMYLMANTNFVKNIFTMNANVNGLKILTNIYGKKNSGF
jgi:hypothetical protein